MIAANFSPDTLLFGGDSAVTTGPVTRTLCPWPQTAVYNGTGPTGDAASFTCQRPRT